LDWVVRLRFEVLNGLLIHSNPHIVVEDVFHILWKVIPHFDFKIISQPVGITKYLMPWKETSRLESIKLKVDSLLSQAFLLYTYSPCICSLTDIVILAKYFYIVEYRINEIQFPIIQ
ncbi:MAG: hypothetical protein JSV38_05740, partial [Desulfobacterales bacterium]